MKKLIMGVMGMGLSFCLSAGGCLSACAGEWKRDVTGQWYQRDDMSYPKGEWSWIDTDSDGIAECYYFNDKGYLVTSAYTPDGYWVNENGAWEEDGMVRQQAAEEASAAEGSTNAANAEQNRQAVAAYRSRLSELVKLSKNKQADSYPARFSVVDINGDGVMEMLVYYDGISAGMYTEIFYFTDHLHDGNITTPLSCTYNPQMGRLMSAYYKQGVDYEVYQFNGTELIKLAELFISDRKYTAEIEQIRQWEEGGLEILQVDLTEENINQYLSGGGLPTGTKASAVYQDVLEIFPQ